MAENILDTGNGPQSKIPNSTIILVLGIAALLGCCFLYGLGIIPGIVGLVMAGKGTKAYNANPDAFLKSSFSQLKAGKIMCWIGVIGSILLLLVIIAAFAMFGMEGIQQIMECNSETDMAERQACIQEVVESLFGQ